MKLNLLFAFFLTFTFLFSKGQTSSAAAEQEFKEELCFLQNVQAPDFKLQDTSGKLISLDEFKNKLVVLDFWFTSCSPCLNNIPYYENTKKFYRDSSNIVFVSICIDNYQRKEHWKKLIKDHAISGINLFLPKNIKETIPNNFYKDTISSFPTYLLVSKTGRILGNLGNIDSLLPLYAIYQGFEGKTTEESFNDFLASAEKLNKWANMDGEKIEEFQKEINALDKNLTTADIKSGE